jgi:hypothetical protein
MSKNELLRNANAAAGSALPFDNISARQHARLRGLLKDIETALAIAGRDHPVVKGIAELLEPAREMAHYDPTGLWQPLGEAWWRRAGEMLGASLKQVRYAAARLNGAKMTASARVAGYEGTSLKQTAQAVDRSSKVTALIARAKQEMERRGAPAVCSSGVGRGVR